MAPACTSPDGLRILAAQIVATAIIWGSLWLARRLNLSAPHLSRSEEVSS